METGAPEIYGDYLCTRQQEFYLSFLASLSCTEGSEGSRLYNLSFDLQTDVKAVDDLTQVEQGIENLTMQLSDTIMLAGSEAYVAALMFYNSVKEAARRNVSRS